MNEREMPTLDQILSIVPGATDAQAMRILDLLVDLRTRAAPPATTAGAVEAVIDTVLRVAPFKDGHETGTSGLVRRADVEQAIRAHFKNTVAGREVEARSSNAPIQTRPQPEEAAQPAPRGVEVGEGSEPSRHAAPATVPPHPELCECGHMRAMHFDEDGDHKGPCLFQVGDQPFCKCNMFHRHARPVPPVDEIVREIDGIFHRWQTEAAPGTCMSDLHHAWNRLRAALSSRTAGEKALSYEEIVKAYVDGASERCPLPLSPTELMSWEECGLHAVHALVAQRGVR